MRQPKLFLFHFNWAMAYLCNHAQESVGGQAVVEGVMMRSPRRLVVAVRAPDGRIVIDNALFVAFSRRLKILGLPILRGAASLVEALAIGVKALNFSVAVAEGKEKETESDSGNEDAVDVDAGPTGKSFSRKSTAKENVFLGISLLVSFALAMGLFQLLPYAVSSWLVGGTKENPNNPFLFNLAAGMVRMTLLVTYMWGVSFFKDIRRIFEYHGAEHKSIFAHENGGELNVGNAKIQSRFHPRCGTSFILIVALTCILFFSVFDAILLGFFPAAYPTFFHRFLIHLPFVPLVAGLAFEVLKFSARHQEAAWIQPLILPGLLLQKITTQEPDGPQLEVAIASINAALE